LLSTRPACAVVACGATGVAPYGMSRRTKTAPIEMLWDAVFGRRTATRGAVDLLNQYYYIGFILEKNARSSSFPDLTKTYRNIYK